MSINTILDQFREEYRGCKSVAFADISTSMVLAMSAAETLPQEFWDEMADIAVANLSSKSADNVAHCLNPDTPSWVSIAIVSEEAQFRIFTRSGVDPAFAICSLVNKEVDFAHFIPAAKTLADQLSENA